jgi:putative restriction endonuclease
MVSLAVRDAYHGACAVTREHSLPALEAAHIQPYVKGGEHRVDNGLLLRSDLQRLYDRGYVTVTPDFVFRVGDSLRDDFKNGRSYYGLAGEQGAFASKPSPRSGAYLGRVRLGWRRIAPLGSGTGQGSSNSGAVWTIP